MRWPRQQLYPVSLFCLVFCIYAITCARGVTFWDSGEFITSAGTLQFTHSPGSPLYTLIASVLAPILGFGNIALGCNLLSALSGAMGSVMVFHVTAGLSARLLKIKGSKPYGNLDKLCGLLAALTLAFSDSYWTISTEAEVYSTAFLLFIVLIHISLLWRKSNDGRNKTKYALLFAFLLGCSVGIHILIIGIVVPATVLLLGLRFRESAMNYMLFLIAGILLFILCNFLVFRGTVQLISFIEVFTVNDLHLPRNTGLWLGIVIIGLIFFLTQSTTGHIFNKLRLIALSTAFFMVGSSTYIAVLLRSEVSHLAAPLTDDPLRLSEYLDTEQFGVDKIPLLYGPTYSALPDIKQPVLEQPHTIVYDQSTKSYITTDSTQFAINYDDRFKQFFPRLYRAEDSTRYKAWTKIEGNRVAYKNGKRIIKVSTPTFKENFSFFVNYQLYWINLRYLFWNYVGRQNTFLGTGSSLYGNWLTGVDIIDKDILGIVPSKTSDLGRYSFYGIPFLMGLMGLLMLWCDRKLFIYMLLLFSVFGFGITIYTNPVPSSIQVRERDYILLGSYVIYAIWIGLSLLLVNRNRLLEKSRLMGILYIALLFAGAPLQMLWKGFDSHDRRLDTFAENFARNILSSTPQGAILITNGDNMTFPLQYLQQVERFRQDIRVINYDLLNVPGKIESLRKPFLKSDAVHVSLNNNRFIHGAERLYPLKKDTDNPIPIARLVSFLNNDASDLLVHGRNFKYFPGTTFSVEVDTTLFNKRYDPSQLNATYSSSISWQFDKTSYDLSDLVIMDILQENVGDRPICFLNNGRTDHLIGLDNELVSLGIVSEFVPLVREKSQNPKIVDVPASYNSLITMGESLSLQDSSIDHSSLSIIYSKEILRQQYYFLAQAMLENDNVQGAVKVLDICIKRFPNNIVPFRQYTYAIGRLYARSNQPLKAEKTRKPSADNVLEDLKTIISSKPVFPIISAQRAQGCKNMWKGMIDQYSADVGKNLYPPELIVQVETEFQEWIELYYPINTIY